MRGVMAASTASGSTLNVCSSMSANTGVACWNRITLADATNENDEVTTSSPGPTPSRARLACRPAVPLEQATAWAVPAMSANASSKRRYIGPQREVAGAQHVEHELLLAAVQVRARQRDLADGDHLRL